MALARAMPPLAIMLLSLVAFSMAQGPASAPKYSTPAKASPPPTMTAAPPTMMASPPTTMAPPPTMMAPPPTMMAPPPTMMAAPPTMMATPPTMMADSPMSSPEASPPAPPGPSQATAPSIGMTPVGTPVPSTLGSGAFVHGISMGLVALLGGAAALLV